MKFFSAITKSIKGFYEAAQTRIYRSAVPGSYPQSARLDISKLTRLECQKKSRHFEKNDPLCSRLGDIFEQFTVGTGLQYFANSSDLEWNSKFQKRWNAWIKSPEVDCRRGFESTQGLIAWRWFFDGEIFVIKTRDSAGKPKIQVIESQRCSTPPEMAPLEGISIFDGVERGKNNAPTRYWFSSSDDIPGESKWIPIESEFVIHVVEFSRAGQSRGLPFLTASIPEAHDLSDLHLLEMKAAKEAARRANVIKKSGGDETDEDLLRRSETVTTEDSQGNSVTETRRKAIQEACGGETIFLDPGEEFEQTKNERPSVVQQEYWQYKTALVCAGSGIPKEIVLASSLTGPAVRGVFDIAAGWFKIRSSTLIGILGLIYEYVAEWEVDNNPELRPPPEDFRSYNCRPPRAINIDVGRNSQAKIAELEAGLGDWEDAWGELGADARMKLRRKAEYVRYIEDLGKEFNIDPNRIAKLPDNPKGNESNVATKEEDT